MKAAILTEIDKPLKIEYIELTDLKIGQVLVKNIKSDDKKRKDKNPLRVSALKVTHSDFFAF